MLSNERFVFPGTRTERASQEVELVVLPVANRDQPIRDKLKVTPSTSLGVEGEGLPIDVINVQNSFLLTTTKAEVLLQGQGTWESIKQCRIPRGLRNFYIEALIIPSSRMEWGDVYSSWDPNQPLLSNLDDKTEERRKRKLTLERKKREKDIRHVVTKYKLQETAEQQNETNISPYVTLEHDHGECQRIRINVSGRIFETQLRTVHRYPRTLLGNPDRRLPFFDPVSAMYYFDRHRDSFEMILYYYQSGGRIQRPYNVSIEVFLSEMVFFDIGDLALLEFRKSEGLYKSDEARALPKNMFQRKIWLLFEYPESSSQSTLVAIISIVAILISITSFCLETIPSFQPTSIYKLANGTMVTEEEAEDLQDSDFSDIFNLIEFNCVLWFVLEIVLRLISSPSKIAFCTNVMNIIDFIAIAPYFVQIGSSVEKELEQDATGSSSSQSKANVNHATYLAVLRVIRLVRVFRIFKLSRHSRGLQILGLTLQASLRELGLLIFFLLIGVILFASAAYTAETSENSKFRSIPHSFYWGIITMTTVGYGDMVPETVPGKMIGAICAIAGVLTIALPVPVIVSNFNFFYMQGTEDKTVESLYNTYHVPMCCYLPGNGVHPDALNEDDDSDDYDGTTKSSENRASYGRSGPEGDTNSLESQGKKRRQRRRSRRKTRKTESLSI